MITPLLASALVAVAAAACSTALGSSSGGPTTTSPFVLPTVTLVPPQGTSSELNAVWCGTPSWCVVAEAGETIVGSSASSAFELDSWDGRSWATMKTAAVVKGEPIVAAITCSSVRSCVAVGADDGAALTLRWDGSDWSQLANPASRSAGLADVACTAPGVCTAVGLGPQGVLTEALVSGRWTIVANPGAGQRGDPGNQLTGIECLTARACLAVGYRQQSIGSEPLVESWDGRRWAVSPSPTLTISPASPGGALDSVQCHSDIDCVAIGNQGGRSLVEAWDGSGWSIENSASVPGVGTYSPFTLSCVGQGWCMTAGAIFSSGMHTVIELSQRSRWSVVDGATVTPDSYGLISSLSCASQVYCLAAGWRSDQPSTPGSALLERWDGTHWTRLSPP